MVSVILSPDAVHRGEESAFEQGAARSLHEAKNLLCLNAAKAHGQKKADRGYPHIANRAMNPQPATYFILKLRSISSMSVSKSLTRSSEDLRVFRSNHTSKNPPKRLNAKTEMQSGITQGRVSFERLMGIIERPQDPATPNRIE